MTDLSYNWGPVIGWIALDFAKLCFIAICWLGASFRGRR